MLSCPLWVIMLPFKGSTLSGNMGMARYRRQWCGVPTRDGCQDGECGQDRKRETEMERVPNKRWMRVDEVVESDRNRRQVDQEIFSTVEVRKVEKQWNGCPNRRWTSQGSFRRNLSRWVRMGRGGTGQGRDRDGGESRVTDAEEETMGLGTTIRDR